MWKSRASLSPHEDGRRTSGVCHMHESNKEKVQYPFPYKNILFKRQFKNKNYVQHHEFFFVSLNKTILRKVGCGVPGAGGQLIPAWLSRRPTGAGSRTPADAPLPSGMVCWERKMTTGLFLLGLKCAGDITNVIGLDTDCV